MRLSRKARVMPKVARERAWWNPFAWFGGRKYDPDEFRMIGLDLRDIYVARGYLDATVSEPVVFRPVATPARPTQAHRPPRPRPSLLLRHRRWPLLPHPLRRLRLPPLLRATEEGHDHEAGHVEGGQQRHDQADHAEQHPATPAAAQAF